MNFIHEIQKAILENIAVKRKLAFPGFLRQIASVADLLSECLCDGHKLLICGNGGSAADAQHTAAELVNRFKVDRQPIAAMALTTDTSILTSIANDYHYNEVFKKQVEAFGKKGDILLALSTSGRSQNVLRAVRAAKKLGLKTIALTGRKSSPLSRLADLALQIPSDEVARIQEAHILILHILCGLVERRYCDDGRP